MSFSKLLGLGIVPCINPVFASGGLLGKATGMVAREVAKKVDLPPLIKKALCDENIFEVKKIRDGCQPTVIFVSGFLNENASGSQWLDFINQHCPNNECLYVKWGAESIGKIIWNSLNSLNSLVCSPASGIIQTWIHALKNTTETGIKLSEYIVRNHAPEKSYIFIGHSLGGRVIFHLLSNFSIYYYKSIKAVSIFGGAVSSDHEEWKPILRRMKGTIFNHYSDNDSTLKWLYKDKIVFSSKPVGLTKISPDSRVVNLDTTYFINSHSAYYENVFDELRCGLKSTSEP